MKIMLSALEQQPKVLEKLISNKVPMRWNLMSYFYIRKNYERADLIKSLSEEVLIDSGAHSFQGGIKVDYVQYTKEYAEWIKKFDSPKVKGYFEMDVDNIIGYYKVLELRKILENVSDKIIPVWHKNRGVQDYKDMCKKYAGKIIAISGGKHDIDNSQFLSFLKYAKKYNCKMHALGMTAQKFLATVPFDYTDSSSWIQDHVFGNLGEFSNGKMTKDKFPKEFGRQNRYNILYKSYLEYQKMQNYYYDKWRTECKD